MTQWKKVDLGKPSGFLDKNGLEIRLGDKVTYRRKVRAEHHWDRKTGSFTKTPGHYEMVTAYVDGFGRIAERHGYKNIFRQIEYLHLREPQNRYVFRVYRPEKLSVVFNSNEK